MRITNKIMQNNTLSNINMAKVTEDAKSSALSSGKQIVRPSDDPIIAIRSLRLRSSVVELTQYYARNAKDADAWLKTTEDAIQQVADVVTNMITQYNKGANEYLTSEERNIILEQLKSLKNEVYATGDADYAGRYIFTGYRTETSLMFRGDTAKTYQITEQFKASDLRTNTFVKTSYEDPDTNKELDLTDLQEGSQKDYLNVDEDKITKEEYHRIRLSYNNCDDALDNTPVGGADNTAKMPVIRYLNATGQEVRIDGNGKTVDGTTDAAPKVECRKSTEVPSPYAGVGDDQVIYLYDTGELLLGNNVYKELSALKDDPLTNSVNEGEIRVSYEKTNFKDGDLRPEHYFYCVTKGEDKAFQNTLGDVPVRRGLPGSTKLSDLGLAGGVQFTLKMDSGDVDVALDETSTLDDVAAVFKANGFKAKFDADLGRFLINPQEIGTENGFQLEVAAGSPNALDQLEALGLRFTDDIVYNPDYLSYGKERQNISYDVGYNQRLQVNTIAEECFNPAVAREVDDMIQALEKMQKIEGTVTTLKNLMAKETNVTSQALLQKQLDAANKALTYERTVVQGKFSSGISEMKGFLNEANIAVTACGARGSRLELVSSRLCSQKTTFETLKSENEDVDLSQAVVELTSAEMTYEAALKATGKIMQVSLMDFI